MRPVSSPIVAWRSAAFAAVFTASIATHQIARAAGDPEPGASDPKAITMIIGYTAGGGVDATGRLISQFLTKYLPGNPPVVIRNIPGADGRVALNFFVRQVKPDGLTLTTGSSTQLDPRNYRVSTAQYDPTKFNFVGGISRGGTFQVISKPANSG